VPTFFSFTALQTSVGTPALSSAGRSPIIGELMMRIWLEQDPVALALLVVGLAAIELLAFIM
jgi:hypothetical protein